MTYVFDTSSLRVFRNYYPDSFPTFWDRLDAAIAAGDVVSVREARRELLEQITEDWLLEWIGNNGAIFGIPTGAETAFVAEIFAVQHFQAMVSARQRLTGKPSADPFVIAAARVCDGCVVTQESKKPNAAKIPNVCDHFRVDYITAQGFFERMGWRF